MKDPIGIVEAAYGLEGSEERWLRSLLEAMRPSFPLGVGGFFFDRAPVDCRWVWGMQGLDLGECLIGAVPALYGNLSPARRVTLLSGPPVLTMAESLRVLGDDALRDFAGDLKVPGALTMTAVDPTGRGCIVGAPTSKRVRLDARSKQAWARVAAHVAAGLRLRRALDALAAEPIEAVLNVDGKVEHAEWAAQSADARAALRRAVQSVERARGRLRRSDPEGALANWHALIAGRWSLIDRFEADGRRFVVALKNDVNAPDPRRLSPRERTIAGYIALGRSNKLIAYSLGLAEGTVAALVSRVLYKLGASGRADCVRFLNEWQTAHDRRVLELGIPGQNLAVLSVHAEQPASGLMTRLSAHEWDVARAAAKGRTNAEIGRALARSPRTVANTLARIYRKIGAGSRAELARLLARGG